jgi:hypothetical protein
MSAPDPFESDKPFPWEHVKTQRERETPAARLARLRSTAEAEHIAAHAERVASLVGLVKP